MFDFNNEFFKKDNFLKKKVKKTKKTINKCRKCKGKLFEDRIYKSVCCECGLVNNCNFLECYPRLESTCLLIPFRRYSKLKYFQDYLDKIYIKGEKKQLIISFYKKFMRIYVIMYPFKKSMLCSFLCCKIVSVLKIDFNLDGVYKAKTKAVIFRYNFIWNKIYSIMLKEDRNESIICLLFENCK